MQKMITDMGFESIVLPVTADVDAAAALKEARDYAERTSSPIFVIVRKDTFSKGNRNGGAQKELDGPFSDSGMSRLEAVQTIDSMCPNKEWMRICTTGKPSRELYDTTVKNMSGQLEDMLVVGSMGHASSIAQGISLGMKQTNNDRKKVLCIDGDGAAIMHMGSLTQGGQLKTPMLHIVLNNGTHESVGMENTAAADPDSLDFTGVAKSCGYEKVEIAESSEDIAKFVEKYNEAEVNGSWMLEVRVGVSDPNAPLPRPKETPAQRKVGVMNHIAM